jgi:predicted acyltransferase
MGSRVLSIDIMRGMTIFFMILVNNPGSWSFVYPPLLHAKWDGCTPTDLVFPFFMFIVGTSMAISFEKFSDNHQLWIQKSVKRGLLIILVGLLLNWFPYYNKNISELRLYGVLQRIGLAYLVASILVTWCRPKYIFGLIALILVIYPLILLSIGNSDLTLEGNLVRKIDLFLLGENHIYKGYGLPFDPEGLLSTLPSVGTILLGFMAGIWMKTKKREQFIYDLLVYGLGIILVGIIWHEWNVPINKPIWSSSYVLYAGGWAMLFWALLYYIIDMLQYKKWTSLFGWFGVNPLACFVLSGILAKLLMLIQIGERSLSGILYTDIYQPTFGDYFGSLMYAISNILVISIVAYFLHKRSIIIKL